jgi:membrane fusion protein, multidrug efflux system
MSINFVPTETDYEQEIAPPAEVAIEESPKNSKRWLWIGAAVLGGVGVSAAIAANTRSAQWSDVQSAPAAVSAPAVKPVAVAAVAPKPPELVRGVISSQNESTIASRMTAGIISMPYRPGQSFRAGALLVSFDCSIQRAQLAAANAATAAYRKTYDTNVELDAYQAVGKNEVGVSKANLGKAQAEANAVSAQIGQCAVYAPFSGKVVEQMAHAHDVAASGQPLMKIQGASALEVQLIIPSNWLTWVKPGVPFAFTIEETGQLVHGKVSRLGASVDPVSKTIRVTGSITPEAGMTILPGMSGSAQFDRQDGNGNPA